MSEEVKEVTALEFRPLKANEIECRVANAWKTGFSILLYKDARCDMNILDETVGKLNWKRTHQRDNANCIVEIWDSIKKQWISKEDVGTASYTEKEKGLASDSFKRSCFNWGIGRELYTAPFLSVRSLKDEVYNNGKGTDKKPKYSVITKVKLYVKEITYNENREIDSLVLYDTNGTHRYTMGVNESERKTTIQHIDLILTSREEKRKEIEAHYQVATLDDLTYDQSLQCKKILLKGK